MERSLAVPTATSVREIPVRLLEENRRLLNQTLADTGRGKVSFTHLVAWAAIRALAKHPSMTASYLEIGGVPHKIVPEQIHFGVAVDVEKKDGTRSLLVPNVKGADRMDFAGFVAAYDDIVERARTNRAEPEDFAGTTLTLTNPGTLGTIHSIPRLMAGQGFILATGAIGYPAEFRSADPRTIASLGISKVMTITSTYDHRVIQGAESGAFLRTLEEVLTGAGSFYEEIFASLGIPHEPLRDLRDRNPIFEPVPASSGLVEKEARVLQLIHTYRVRGHLIADLNPLETEVATYPELDPAVHGLTVWDLDREFHTGGLAGRQRATLREIWTCCARPTAARSRSSTCTSRSRSRSNGSASAWEGCRARRGSTSTASAASWTD